MLGTGQPFCRDLTSALARLFVNQVASIKSRAILAQAIMAQIQVRVILVVLHLKTRDRWQMVPGILRLLASARSWVLGTALPVESVGSSQILHCEIRAELVRDRSPLLEPARLRQAVQKSGGVVDSLSKCDAAVWEAAKGALTASQQSEIEHKRRVVVEQPTAHSARKQLEQEVAALFKFESAFQRQHKAAVDSYVLLAETSDKVKEQKTRVQQASVQAALETSTEAGAHHAGALGRSNPQRTAALLPAARHSQPGHGILPHHTRPTALVFPEAAGPLNATCSSIDITQFQLPSQLPFPVSRHGREQGGCGGMEF